MTQLPPIRLTRASKGTTFLSHPETGRTHDSVCTRPAAQQSPPNGGVMQTLVERGCGLDVHQATVVACLLMVRRDGEVQKQMRTFGTTTRELVGLREWVLSEGCTHVAIESTGCIGIRSKRFWKEAWR